MLKMKLKKLLEGISYHKIRGNLNLEIKGISDDSRKVKRNYLFVAVAGLKADGHDFIAEAIVNGAAAIVAEKDLQPQAAYIRVKNSRETLSLLAAKWWGNPGKKLKVIGVTGTDGKTTTANLIYFILKTAGKRVGLVSTIGAKIRDKEIDTGLHVTNPEPLALYELLAKMVKANCEYAVLEVTSHGLDQERVSGISFEVGVLTNITHEHLDYHKSFDNYVAAKAKLFANSKAAVLNRSDASIDKIRSLIPDGVRVYEYGADTLKGKILEVTRRRFPEKYNQLNAAGAVAVAKILGVEQKYIKAAVSSFPELAGRMQAVRNKKGIKIYIDFAHTANALENALKALRLKTPGRLIAVFGCAGERDIKKRVLMPQVSVKLADLSVFTAEDPRSEDVSSILAVMANAAKKAGGREIEHNFVCIQERGEAIAFALRVAKKGDTVIVCGKGHEKSMAYDGVEYAWSDQGAVRIALSGRIKKIKRVSKKVHFMGIGGSALSGVAIMASRQGFKVSGCDLEMDASYLSKVKKAGIKVYVGHDKKHLEGIDILAVSPAVIYQNRKHPEYKTAEKMGILTTWDQFVGKYLLREKETLCITGTHGKSTTTAMASLLFEKAGLDPSCLVGATVKEWGSNYRIGNGNFFVIEADDFYEKFLNYQPSTIILNNIEFDHPDFFKNEAEMINSYLKFVRLLQGAKNLIINQDSPGNGKLLRLLDKKFVKSINVCGYTLLDDPPFRLAKSLRSKILRMDRENTLFRVSGTGLDIRGDYKLKIPGIHNVSNALGVIILAKLYGIKDAFIKESLSGFKGVDRRLEMIGEKNGIKVYDDYAHHPTAIRETLKALRQKYPKERIWGIIEPHSFSRTKVLLNEYEGVFKEANKVIVGPIFKARDKKTFGVDGSLIVKASKHQNALYEENIEKIVSLVSSETKPGDIILVMGAGKSYLWARKILQRLK